MTPEEILAIAVAVGIAGVVLAIFYRIIRWVLEED